MMIQIHHATLQEAQLFVRGAPYVSMTKACVIFFKNSAVAKHIRDTVNDIRERVQSMTLHVRQSKVRAAGQASLMSAVERSSTGKANRASGMRARHTRRQCMLHSRFRSLRSVPTPQARCKRRAGPCMTSVVTSLLVVHRHTAHSRGDGRHLARFAVCT